MRYRFGGLIFGGAYTWRGLFSEFYGILSISHPLLTPRKTMARESSISDFGKIEYTHFSEVLVGETIIEGGGGGWGGLKFLGPRGKLK